MTLTITHIPGAGNLERERVVLRADADCDIGDYALFQGRAAKEGNVLAGDVPRAYWFTEKRVASGDLIILYTKSGQTSEKKNENGSTSHFFYWGRQAPLWDQKSIVATLVDTPDWKVWRDEAPSE